ncbi:MAG TPA: nucleotidyltransferase family protein, partial [Longimicrobium sp.]|nr:nucleotidyltransferase family protein [Longimicrobium sp.]
MSVSREALALRAWALRVLAGDARAPAPGAGEGAWRLFLETEGCAAPLWARLSAAGAAEGLAEGARALLAARATDETRRFLSARAHLRTLGKVAAERGTEIVALKGGAHAAEGGEPLDLADLDLLLPEDEAGAFAEAIGARGYAPVRDDPDRDDDDWHHLAQRVAPGGIQVEIHYRLRSFADAAPLRARALPVAGLPATRRLAPADHAWHLLLHAVVESPFRRGRLRDLLLAGRELARMGADDAAEVERRVAAHPFAAPLGAFA